MSLCFGTANVETFFLLAKKYLTQFVSVHRDQEFFVVAGLFEAALHEFHGFQRGHVGQVVAQDPDAVDIFGIVEQVVAAGGAERHVDGREDAAVGELAVELELEVAGALEFLEDHVVHLGAGLRKGRRQDGERSAAFDVAGGAEEALGLVEGVGVDTA